MKFSQGVYQVKNPEKYMGNRAPTYRSGWEYTFMTFCDNNPSIQQWSSESIKIPYRDPLTGKNTIYIPDFLISYVDKKLKKHVELIEIKPSNQMIAEKVGKNPYNQAQYVKNMAKWEAAGAWCRSQGIKFRILNEIDIYQNTKKVK
jgi:TnsA endonuclease N terminal